MYAYTVETYLHLYEPVLIDAYLYKKQYPIELRICIKAKYDRCELRFGSYGPWYNRRFHIINPIGSIELKKSEANQWVSIFGR